MSKEIAVTVGGALYPAVIDKNGTLRFKSNWCVKMHYETNRQLDMNRLAILFQDPPGDGEPSQREYAEFHMMIGYSLDGFCELSSFEDLEVVTPEWTRKGKRPWKTFR